MCASVSVHYPLTK